MAWLVLLVLVGSLTLFSFFLFLCELDFKLAFVWAGSVCSRVLSG